MLQFGIDLARDRDRTAMVLVERSGSRIRLRKAVILPYGKTYAEQKAALSEALRGISAVVAVDATGVGAAVADFLEADGHHLRRVTITGGKQVHQRGDAWGIPKSILINLLVGALDFRDLDLSAGGPELQRELQVFARRGGRLTGKHAGGDDLVMALALACFPFGELRPRGYQ